VHNRYDAENTFKLSDADKERLGASVFGSKRGLNWTGDPSDQEAIAAFVNAMSNSYTRNQVLVGMTGRGLKDTGVGLWDTAGLIYDNTPMQIMMRGGLSPEAQAIGQAVANGTPGFLERYVKPGGSMNMAADLTLWFAGNVRGDMVDSGRSMLKSGTGDPFTYIKAGYEADFLGGFAAEIVLTGLTAGASNIARVRYLSKLDDLGDFVRAFRVEGTPNSRFAVDDFGNVSLTGGDQTIWLNFGQESRAADFLTRRIDQGLPGANLKSFDVDKTFVEMLRKEAVPEGRAKFSPTKPIQSADPFPDQFGVRPEQFNDLMRAIRQGSGAIDG
jgi:hypothetical protein